MEGISQRSLQKTAVYALAFLWIFTGLTSIFFSPEIGYQILASASINGLLADVFVYAGGGLDIALGLWLLSSVKRAECCAAQIALIVLYTVLLTFIEPNFWLHPFGPITKNIPIIVLIFIVLNKSERLE